MKMNGSSETVPEQCPTPSRNAMMRDALPKLKEAVLSGWRNYRLSADHDQINAMRDEVKLLLYWLARQVAIYSPVEKGSSSAKHKMSVGTFGGFEVTELQHALWERALSKHTVTELVNGAQTDIVAFLRRMLVLTKIDLYRHHQTGQRLIANAGDMAPDDENGSEIEDMLDACGANPSTEDCVLALDSLQRFFVYLEKQQLNPKLEQVIIALWLSTPLSDKKQGDTSDNKANQDDALAKELGIPKKSFDGYKAKAKELISIFRRESGW